MILSLYAELCQCSMKLKISGKIGWISQTSDFLKSEVYVIH